MPTSAGRSSVGRYELRERLGTGGMGTVWHAWDPSLQRDVAVKEVVMPDGMDPDELSEMRARTLREAQATARISHTAVVTIHDVLDQEESPWIVMELLSGTSLQTLLDRSGPMPVEQVEDTARALLGGLKAAHGVGVTHRDIKPANVMRTDDDRTVLTDFGIANVDGSTALTQTGVYIGSPEYMAPERFEGERALPASDMWSLGVTLCTLLEGQSPFKRDSITGIISAVLTAPMPPELLSVSGGATDPSSAPLRTLIGALLTREVSQRPDPAQAIGLLERAKQAPGVVPGGASGGQHPAPYPSGPQAPVASGPQVPVSGPQAPHAAASGPQAPVPPSSGPQPGVAPAPPHANTPHPNAPGQPSMGQPAPGPGGIGAQGYAPHWPSGPHAAPGPQGPGGGPHPAQVNNNETSGTGFVRGIHHTGYHQFGTAQQPAPSPPAATGQFTPGQPVGSPPTAHQPSWRRAKPDMAKPASVITAAVMLGINALYLMVLTALFLVDVIGDGDTEWVHVLLVGGWGLVSAFAAVGLMTRSRLLYGLVLIVQAAASVMLVFSMFSVLVYAPAQLPLYLVVLVFNLTIGALLLIPGKARAFFGFGANFQ